MHSPIRNREKERGAALVIAILVLAILTVIGIALMLITSTETRIAANEWSINRGFYSSDAGVRWASSRMSVDILGFLSRPEFGGSKETPIFDGTVLFNMPSHRFVTGAGFVGTDDIQVRVSTPGRLSRRHAVGFLGNNSNSTAMYMWRFELRATGSQNDAFLQYSKALVADIEAGPAPVMP